MASETNRTIISNQEVKKFSSQAQWHDESHNTYPRGSNNHPCPVGEGHVVVILEAPTDGAVTYALLALLELFQQSEVARHN